MAITAERLIELMQAFPWDTWNAKLEKGLTQCYRDVVQVAGGAVLDDFDMKDPFTSKFMTEYIGERIVTLDAFTKQRVSELIRQVLASSESVGVTELAGRVRDQVAETFEGWEHWRAQRIARTETGFAYNHGTVLGHKQSGGSQVDVFDGDKDADCAAANGSVWTVEQALDNPLGHPNCVRSFSPHLEP